MKALKYKNDYVVYHCPGCKGFHYIPFAGPKKWEFNNDFDNPTLSPSILERQEGYRDPETNAWEIEPRTCHHFIRNGKIELLSDSTHGVHGTFELKSVDEWAKPWMFEPGSNYEKVSG
jgi:hypothetical protein